MNTLSKLQRDYDAMTPPEDYVYSDDEEFSIKQMQTKHNCDRFSAIAILKDKGSYDYEYE